MSQDDEFSSPIPSYVTLHMINPKWIVECSPDENTESPLDLFDSPYYSTETDPGDMYLNSQPVDKTYELFFIDTLLRNLEMVSAEKLSRGAGSSRCVARNRLICGSETSDPVHCCVYSAFATRASRGEMLDWSTRGGGIPGAGRSHYSTTDAVRSAQALVARDGDEPPQTHGGSICLVALSRDERRMARFFPGNWYLGSQGVVDPPTADPLPPAWKDFEHSSIFNAMRNWVSSLNRPSNRG